MIAHSRRYDITAYLASVRTSAEQLSNELLKVQAAEYLRFVAELSDLANIMQKNFYVVLPLTVVPISESKGFFGGFKDMFKKSPATHTLPAEQLATYKAQLQQRADLIIGGLSGMSLKGAMLNQDELTALFNDVYNPFVPAQAQSNT